MRSVFARAARTAMALALAACIGSEPTPAASDAGSADSASPSDAAADSDAGSDAGADGPPAACDVGKPFGAPVLVASLASPPANTAMLRITADSLYGVFHSDRDGGIGQGGVDFYSTKRAARANAFGAVARLANVGGAGLQHSLAAAVLVAACIGSEPTAAPGDAGSDNADVDAGPDASAQDASDSGQSIDGGG